MSKRTNLPPLNPLHVFAVASKLGSFTKAAQELNITQSAVSRQISTLEASLNIILFRRGKNGVELTEYGEYYHREVGAAFSRIETATHEISQARLADPLRLRVYSTFAVNWLIPRLPSFKRRYPDIKLQLTTAVQPVDFTRDAADFAIQFGNQNWTGAFSRKILPDVLQPVCSPQYKEKLDIAEPRDLLRAQLLNARLRSKDWKDWLAARGLSVDRSEFAEFPSSFLSYQAAVAGMGIAMGQTRLIHRYFESRELVPLFEEMQRDEYGYHVLWPESISLSRKSKAFLRWLIDESGSYA